MSLPQKTALVAETDLAEGQKVNIFSCLHDFMSLLIYSLLNIPLGLIGLYYHIWKYYPLLQN
jgi:hypothetical protein